MVDMAYAMDVFQVQQDHNSPTPLSSTTSFTPTSTMVLPEPTYSPPDLKKKSHTRKQPIGHIPRPRNPFILFRSDFVRQKKIPANVENDHRNISRIVGQIWRQMNDKQREPWVLMAEKEKLDHSKLYNSHGSSTAISNKKVKRGDDVPHETQDHHLWNDSDLLDLYRSSSCPPGTLHVPQANLESCNGYGAPLKTRDDMVRRPSRVTFYQSTSHQSAIINDQRYVEFIEEDYFKAVANQEYYTEAEERNATFDKDMPEGNLEMKFCGPRINVHPYPIPGPNDSPQWDVPSIQPHTWTDWSAFQFNQSSSSAVSNEIFGTPDVNKIFSTDPFLSTLPPLPYPYDPFPPLDYSLESSFTTLETSELSDALPNYVTRYHDDSTFQNFGYSDQA